MNNLRWAQGWRATLAGSLLGLGIGLVVIGILVLDIHTIQSDFQKEYSKDVNVEDTSKILLSIDALQLSTTGSSLLAIGIALSLGSYPFFESYVNLRKKAIDDFMIINPIIVRCHSFIDAGISEYTEHLELALSRDTIENQINIVHAMLMGRFRRWEDFFLQTERDIQFLQLKNPDLYEDMVRIIQSNRVLLNPNRFENIQPTFEPDTMIAWIGNIRRLLPILRSVNHSFIQFQNEHRTFLN